eukprot:TRINITY_DN31927_c0_g1_i1.p1 TRINITY_DN31927_c0_g1~~TRINITY_DN31927_c0_g1_i1.p1  ORF type:complete len:2493 (+),score=477.17 TRINITY_DN31927_c0_g1_i1:176-7654(+)
MWGSPGREYPYPYCRSPLSVASPSQGPNSATPKLRYGDLPALGRGSAEVGRGSSCGAASAGHADGSCSARLSYSSRTPTPSQWGRNRALHGLAAMHGRACSSHGSRGSGCGSLPGVAGVSALSCSGPSKTPRPRPPSVLEGRPETSCETRTLLDEARRCGDVPILHEELGQSKGGGAALQPLQQQAWHKEDWAPSGWMRTRPTPLCGASASPVAVAEPGWSCSKASQAATAARAIHGISEDMEVSVGGLALRPLPRSSPAKMAGPMVSPHNAWCTLVSWVPPADGEADADLRYELNCAMEGSPDEVVLRDLGQEPWVQLIGLAAGRKHHFQVRAANSAGHGDWSNWSVGYLVPTPPPGPASLEKPRSTTPQQGLGGSRPRSGAGHSASAVEGGARPPSSSEKKRNSGRQGSRPRSGGWIAPRLPGSSSMSPSCARLQWEEPCSHGAPIVGYRVQYGADPENPVTVVLMKPQTFLEVFDLMPNTIHYFRVKAINEVGESPWTAWSEGIATAAIPPEAPREPHLLAAKPRELLVGWEAPKHCGFEALRYDVRVSRDPEQMEDAVILCGSEVDAHERSVRLMDLEPSMAYYFQVRAENALGLSEWSATSAPIRTWTAVPERCPVPRVTRNELGVMEISWEAPRSHGLAFQDFLLRWCSDAKGLRETGRKLVPGAGYSEGDVVSATLRVRPSETFYFQVSATNAVGAGEVSRISEQVVAQKGKPMEPAAPDIAQRTPTSLLVEVLDKVYDNGSEVTRYELRYYLNDTLGVPVECGAMYLVRDDHHVTNPLARHSYREPPALPPRRFQRALAHLVERGPYFFSVRAVNAMGYSPWSSPSKPAWLTLSSPGTLSAPTLRKALTCNSLLLDYMPSPQPGMEKYEMRFTLKRDAELLMDDEVPAEVADPPDIETAPLSLLSQAANDSSNVTPERCAVSSLTDSGQATAVKTLRDGCNPDNVSKQTVRCFHWQATWKVGNKPPPVLVDELLTGRTYVFQIRVLEPDGGASQWSEVSEPFPTLPAVAETPVPPELNFHEPVQCQTTLHLLLPLPDPCGKPITKLRLRLWGPSWKNCPPPTEWKDVDIIDESKCDEILERPCPTGRGKTTLWQYTATHLQAGAYYQFSVCCLNEIGWSEWSDASERLRTGNAEPNRPQAPTVVEDDGNSESFTIQWQAPHDAGSEILFYRLRWTRDPAFTDYSHLRELPSYVRNVYQVEDITDTKYTLQKLQPHKWYYFQVAAVNACGQGHYSSVDTGTKMHGVTTGTGCYMTRPRLPDPVREVKAYVLENEVGKVRVTWNPPLQDGGRRVSRYHVYYSTFPDFQEFTEVMQKAKRQIVLTGLQPEMVYYVDVAAANPIGAGPWTGKPRSVKTNPMPPSKFVLPKRPEAPTWEIIAFEESPAHSQKTRSISASSPVIFPNDGPAEPDSPQSTISAKSLWTPAGSTMGSTMLTPHGGTSGRRQSAMSCQVWRKGFTTTVIDLNADVIKAKLSWKCPENYHKTRGFIYDEETQTHIIEKYSIRVVTFPEGQLYEEKVLEEAVIPEGEPTIDTVTREERNDILDRLVVERLAKSPMENVAGEGEVPAELLFEAEQVRDRRSVPKDVSNFVFVAPLLPGRWYYAIIRAHNAAGDGMWSMWSEAFKSPPAPPPPILGAMTETGEREPAVRYAGATAQTLTIEWDAPFHNGEPLAKYIVSWCRLSQEDRAAEVVELPFQHMISQPGQWKSREVDVADCDIPTDSSVEGEERSLCRWTIPHLRRATTYLVEVKGQNRKGMGSSGESEPLRTRSDVPGASVCVRGLPELATPHEVTLQWEPPEDDGGEKIMGYEVRWCILTQGEPIPSTLEAVLDEAHCAERLSVSAETRQHVAKGIPPADAAIVVIRSFNVEGYGPWSPLPTSMEQVKALSTLPTPPSILPQAPVFVRDPGEAVRPYTLSAHWRCPKMNGRPLRGFQLRLLRVDPAAPGEVPQGDLEEGHSHAAEFTLEHLDGDRRWEEGQELCWQNVHAPLIPGISYVLQVRAWNEVGYAEAWGPPSVVEVAPPDTPTQPEVPTSKWQWPTGIEVQWVEPYMNGSPLEGLEVIYSLSEKMERKRSILQNADDGNFDGITVIAEGLKSLTHYYFKLRVRNALGWSDWSGVSAPFPTTTTRPKAPEAAALMQMWWDETLEVAKGNLRCVWEPARDHGSKITHYEIVLVLEGKSETTPSSSKDLRLAQAVEAANDLPADAEEERTAALQERAKVVYMKQMLTELLEAALQTEEENDEAEEVISQRLQRRNTHTKLKRMTTQTGGAMTNEESMASVAPPGKILSHSVCKLYGGNAYSLSVRAWNELGWSNWSPPCGPMVTPQFSPDMPLLMTNVDSGMDSLTFEYTLPESNGDRVTSLEFVWKLISSPAQSNLHKPRRPTDQSEEAATEPEVETSGVVLVDCPSVVAGENLRYTLQGLRPGTEYEVAFRAANSLGFGPMSLGVRARCKPGLPEAPGSIRHIDELGVTRRPVDTRMFRVPELSR